MITNKNNKKTFASSASFALIILLLSCSPSNDWVQFRGEGGRGASNTRISPPLGVRWKIKLQENDDILESMNPPIIMGNTIYFGSDDGNFYALDVDSGYMRWVFKSGAPINSIPYADKDQVYFGSKDGKLYSLNRATGRENWAFSAYSEINSQVQRYGDNIIFVGDADAFYFLSPDGELQHTIYNPGWYHFTFLVDNNIIYNATGPTTRQVGPYDINKKEFLWWMPYDEIRATWYSFIAIKDDLLYMGTADIYFMPPQGTVTELVLYAVNRHTGAIEWKQDAIGDFKNYIVDGYEGEVDFFWRNINILDWLAPAVWKDTVIFAGGDRVVRAYDAKTGAPKWESAFDAPVSCAPTIAGDRVYFGLMGSDFSEPKLVCISARNGRPLWEMEIEGSILSAPVIAGKRIVFGTDRSVFYVMEEVF